MQAARRVSPTALARKRDSWSLVPILNITKETPRLNTIRRGLPASHAVVDMLKYDCGSLVVTEPDGAIAGIVTERDMLSKLPLKRGGARMVDVEDIMTPRSALVVKPATATLEQCVSAMREGGFRHLPLAGRGGDFKAIISSRDIAQHVLAALRCAPAAELPSVAELMAARQAARGAPSPAGDMRADHVVEAESDASVAETVSLMREQRAGSVLLREADRDGTRLLGIMTERDYLFRFVAYDEHSPTDVVSAEIMTSEHDGLKCVCPEVHCARAPGHTSTHTRPEHRPQHSMPPRRHTARSRSSPTATAPHHGHPPPPHPTSSHPSSHGQGSIKDALAAMVDGGFRHVPVTEHGARRQGVGHGHLFGVISMRDIMNYCWELHHTPTADATGYIDDATSRVDTILEIEAPRGSPGRRSRPHE